MTPIIVESVSDNHINATQCYSINIAWTGKLFCPMNPDPLFT